MSSVLNNRMRLACASPSPLHLYMYFVYCLLLLLVLVDSPPFVFSAGQQHFISQSFSSRSLSFTPSPLPWAICLQIHAICLHVAVFVYVCHGAHILFCCFTWLYDKRETRRKKKEIFHSFLVINLCTMKRVTRAQRNITIDDWLHAT